MSGTPRFERLAGEHETLLVFQCPGCNFPHSFRVWGSAPTWTWNRSIVHATFRPSLRVEWTHGPNHEKRQCHSFVTDGQIRFLEDCTHALAGQTVDIPEVK